MTERHFETHGDQVVMEVPVNFSPFLAPNHKSHTVTLRISCSVTSGLFGGLGHGTAVREPTSALILLQESTTQNIRSSRV